MTDVTSEHASPSFTAQPEVASLSSGYALPPNVLLIGSAAVALLGVLSTRNRFAAQNVNQLKLWLLSIRTPSTPFGQARFFNITSRTKRCWENSNL